MSPLSSQMPGHSPNERSRLRALEELNRRYGGDVDALTELQWQQYQREAEKINRFSNSTQGAFNYWEGEAVRQNRLRQQQEKDARIVREREQAEKLADQRRRVRQLPHAVENWRQGMEQGIGSGLAPYKEFARKEREIGRPLNQSEKNYYLQYGGYPASQERRLRNMSWDDLNNQENSPSYAERRRRVQEARNRTPLENAIRRWFTPVKNQIPDKYLQ